MGNDVAGKADARAAENSDSSVGSSLRVQAGSSLPARDDGLRNVLAPARLRAVVAGAVVARRRAAALELGVDHLLVEASVRAAEQLKTTRPKLSAATLKLPCCGILGCCDHCRRARHHRARDCCGITGSVSYLDVLWPVPHFLDGCSLPEEEDEPIYSVIAPLRGEAKVVDQLLTAIERLNHPAEKLDVIIAAEANDDPCSDHGAEASHSHHGHSRPVKQTRYEAKRTERSASFCPRRVHRDLRRRGPART